MSDIVWAGMATLKDRDRNPSIESILPQVDMLSVHYGDGLGDIVKFTSCAEAPGYFFTIDDDLIYPPDYVEKTLKTLKHFPRMIVSWHGWNIDKSGNRIDYRPALADVEKVGPAHVVGTSSCAFHTDTIRPTLKDFPMKMADIWLGIKARKEGIIQMVLPHSKDFFRYVRPDLTIWDETQNKTGSFLDYTEDTAIGLRELVKLIYG